VVSVDVVTGQIKLLHRGANCLRAVIREPQVARDVLVMTTASSMTRPIAIAIAPSVMRLNV